VLTTGLTSLYGNTTQAVEFRTPSGSRSTAWSPFFLFDIGTRREYTTQLPGDVAGQPS
jgi:hypothetical protein